MTTQYCTRDGRTVDASEALDADGTLRNGYGIRTPIHLMDSMQRDIAGDAGHKHDAAQGFTDSRGVFYAADQRVTDAQRATDYAAGREEGLRQKWRDGRAEAAEARQAMIADMAVAWKDAAPPAGAYPYEARLEGTQCTIDGADGRLEKKGDYLVCVPIRKSDRPGASSDAHPTGDARASAYEEMVRDTDYRTRNHG